jgi:hypothetical protein
LERFESFPGYRCRLSPNVAEHRYFEKLQRAAEVMRETDWLVAIKTD